MRKFYFAVAASFVLLVSGCTKKSTNSFSANVNATIGTNPFISTHDHVDVNEEAPVAGGTVGGTEQVTITATSDVDASSYLVIAFGYAANDVKTYNISDDGAICAYHASGASNDELASSGTVTITSNNGNDVSNGKHLSGTFDFTTYSGVHVTGYFGVQVDR